MERWSGGIAVVTDASSAIGSAIVKDLLKANMKVVGLASSKGNLKKLYAELPVEQKKRFHSVQCDVSSLESITAAFDSIRKNLGFVDVLINNVGVFGTGEASAMKHLEMDTMLETILIGVVFCTHRAFRGRDKKGHVVIINSIAGHNDTSNINGLSSLTQAYRVEIRGLDPKIQFTGISPETDLMTERSPGGKNLIFHPADISSCVLFALASPALVQEIIVKPKMVE